MFRAVFTSLPEPVSEVFFHQTGSASCLLNLAQVSLASLKKGAETGSLSQISEDYKWGYLQQYGASLTRPPVILNAIKCRHYSLLPSNDVCPLTALILTHKSHAVNLICGACFQNTRGFEPGDKQKSVRLAQYSITAFLTSHQGLERSKLLVLSLCWKTMFSPPHRKKKTVDGRYEGRKKHNLSNHLTPWSF